ncbi:unnamed protein product [Peniophora sp. CBMAI 1063]|nr:unnamed protein product [Peniophora sp. CBMAI 1063]
MSSQRRTGGGTSNVLQSPRQTKEKTYHDAQSERLDATLAFYISGALSAGESKFAGLEDMHGRHGHPVEWWKDYYLIHQTRLDALVATVNRRAFPTSTATTQANAGSSKPSASAPIRKRRRTPPPVASGSNTTGFADDTQESSSGRPLKASRRVRESGEISSGRRTSQGGSAPVSEAQGSRTDLVIPSTLPSEPPQPSTRSVALQSGKNSYTPEDISLFINTILWHAKSDPEASLKTLKKDILLDVAAKATHHSHGSWAAYWSLHKADDVLEEGIRMAELETATRRDTSRIVKNEVWE